MTPSPDTLDSNREAPNSEPDVVPPTKRMLCIAIGAHITVLAARARWVETDPEIFSSSAISAIGVFLVGPAALVALALGVPSNWNRARMWNGVAFAWLVTAAVHALIVLGAATRELPSG